MIELMFSLVYKIYKFITFNLEFIFFKSIERLIQTIILINKQLPMRQPVKATTALSILTTLILIVSIGKADVDTPIKDVYQPELNIFLDLPTDYDESQADPSSIEIHPIQIKTHITTRLLVDR